MNILEQEDIIKGLPDQALMQEAQMPSGQVPQYLVVSEIQRRSDMRKRYKAGQEQMPQATVKEQVMQEGIMGAIPQMPPQMAMAPQMPQRMPQMPPPQMPPQGIEQAMPPQMMFGGGVVRMKKGGYLDQQLDLLGKKFGGLGGAIKGLESAGNQEGPDGSTLRSEAGALGVMQLMPKTAALPGYNIPSIFDLARNAGIEVNEDQVTFDTVELDDGRIRKIPTAEATAEAARLLGNKKLNELMGFEYLDGMVNTFSGRAETPEDLVDLVGIAYNAGPEVAKAWDGNPERLNDETRRYIDRLGDNPDAVSSARVVGGFGDEPEAGSPEAQAKVVEAIQRNRAAPPARSAEEQLLDMGLNPIQASNLELGIGPRGPASPFGAPPADRSGVAALPADLGIGPDGPVRYPFGAPAPDKSGVSALPVDLGIGPDGPVRYPLGAPASDRSGIAVTGQNVFGTGFGDVRDAVSADPVSDGIVSTRPDIFGTGFGDVRDGDARMQATDSAEVQSESRELLPRAAGAGQGLGFLEATGLGSVFQSRGSANPLGRTRTPIEPEIKRPSVFGTGFGDVRDTMNVAAGNSAGSQAPPVDANGIAPEAPAINALVNTPSGDRSNPASMDITSPDYDLAEVIARNQGIYDPFKFDLTKGETEPKPTPDVTSPEFNISDILENSRRMNQANILMQLGAGIAAGDVSKGLSAAGAAAASGAKEIRDLDMKSRLAKFQAGREDQKRETAASQFDRQMTLLEEKVKNAAEYGGAARDAAFIRVVGDDLERARDALKIIDPQKYPVEYKKAMTRIKTLEETLYGVAGIGMPTAGTGDTGGVGSVGGAGITDFNDVTGSQAIVGG